MSNLVVASHLLQTSAPCFIFKPLPLQTISPCISFFVTYSLTKSKSNKPFPLIVQAVSLRNSPCFGFFHPLLPSSQPSLMSSLLLSHLYLEEDLFNLPPSNRFFLNLSFQSLSQASFCPVPHLPPAHSPFLYSGSTRLLLVHSHQNQLRQHQTEKSRVILQKGKGRALLGVSLQCCFSRSNF